MYVNLTKKNSKGGKFMKLPHCTVNCIPHTEKQEVVYSFLLENISRKGETISIQSNLVFQLKVH